MNETGEQSLVSQIVTALQNIKDVFMILTSRLTDNQTEFSAISRCSQA